MKIAIPTADGKLAMHFGHCEKFVFINVDENKKKIVDSTEMVPPPHEPGVLPKWLGDLNVDLIIAGGMGMRAIDLFTAQDIKVLVGAPADSPNSIINAYLDGRLETGQNVCDH
jgi:ATP-binding protein involved in chromosome partitioning